MEGLTTHPNPIVSISECLLTFCHRIDIHLPLFSISVLNMFLIVLLLFSAVAYGSTSVYVDCSKMSSGDGTLNAPFSSVSDVNALSFSAGDAILLKRGTTCSGKLLLQGSGSESSWIRLSAYGQGNSPVVNGSGYDAAIEILNSDYWEVSDLIVTNPSSETGLLRRGFVASTNDSHPHQGLTVRNIYAYDVGGATDKFAEPGNFASSAGIFVSSSAPYNDIEVFDNTIHDCGGGGIKVRGGVAKGRGSGVHVHNNDVTYCGGDGIVVEYTEGPLIEKNHVGWLGLGAYPWTGGNFAGIWVMVCKDSTMRFNYVHDSIMSAYDSEAFDCDWGNEGFCAVEYNYGRDNAGGWFLNCDGCGDIVGGAHQIVRYNVFENDCRSISTGDEAQLDVYNNVFFCNEKNFNFSLPSNTSLVNNIFVGNNKSSLPSGSVWHKNIFQFVDLPTEDAGISANPLFIDPYAKDTECSSVDGYKLQKGSPAWYSGQILPDNGSHDLWGNKITDTINIGAYNGGNSSLPHIGVI